MNLLSRTIKLLVLFTKTIVPIIIERRKTALRNYVKCVFTEIFTKIISENQVFKLSFTNQLFFLTFLYRVPPIQIFSHCFFEAFKKSPCKICYSFRGCLGMKKTENEYQIFHNLLMLLKKYYARKQGTLMFYMQATKNVIKSKNTLMHSDFSQRENTRSKI